MSSTLQKIALTTGDVARHFGCQVWQVRRLFERHLLPRGPKFGAYYLIPAEDLPRVEAALRAAGYLPARAPEVAGCR
jgi:hypothetical protein